MTIYRTIIYKVTTDVIGLDVEQNNGFKTEWETNHKSSAVPISEIVIAQTAYLQDKMFDDLEDLVTEPLDWGDVKYVETDNKYAIYLVT